MSQKKIIIVTTSNLAFDHRMQRCINTLLEANYHVTCYSRKFNTQDNYLPINSQSYKQIRISTLFQSSWLFYAEYNFRLFFALLFIQQDLIYAVDSDTLLPSTLVKIIKNKKLIYDAHEYFEQSPEIINKPFIQKAWNIITTFGTQHSDLNITVGQELAKVLSLKYKTKFVTIRNIPDLPQIQYNNKVKSKIIWYHGVLNIGRGLETMINAMKKLPNYELHIAGEGDISNLLRDQTNKLGLSNNIVFLGQLSLEEIAIKIHNARIGINLLENQSQNYYYSLANRAFFYIHSGLPSIHMNFPEYRNINSEYNIGILINEINEDEIINSIRTLEDPNFYNTLIENCKKAKNALDWSSEKNKLIEEINKL